MHIQIFILSLYFDFISTMWAVSYLIMKGILKIMLYSEASEIMYFLVPYIFSYQISHFSVNSIFSSL